MAECGRSIPNIVSQMMAYGGASRQWNIPPEDSQVCSAYVHVHANYTGNELEHREQSDCS